MHKIQKQIIEIKISSQSEAYKIQEEISRIYHQRLLPLIDQICTQHAQPQTTYRISQLTLDLGTIPLQNLEEHLVTQLKKQLSETLNLKIQQNKLSPIKTPEFQEIPITQSQIEAITHFLLHGSLPWWNDTTNTNPETLLLTIINETPLQLKQTLITQYNPSIPLRLSKQISIPTLKKLITSLFPQISKALFPFQETTLKHLQAFPNPLPKQTLWQTILEQYLNPIYQNNPILPTQTTTINQTTTTTTLLFLLSKQNRQSLIKILEQWQTTPLPQSPINIPQVLSLLKRILTSNEESKHIEQTTNSLSTSNQPPTPLITSDISTNEEEKVNNPLNEQPPITQQPTDPEFPQKTEDQLITPESQQPIDNPQTETPLIEETNTDLPKWKQDSIQLRDRLLKATQNPNSTNTSTPYPKTKKEAYYIKNAGLILISPFLTHLFQNTALTKDNQFTSDQNQETAANILQYIATSQTDNPEHLLTLNKLLCGIPLQAPINKTFTNTPTIENEIDQLYQTIQAYWPPMQGTTFQGFQKVFLQREARLSTQESGWLLKVDRKAWDILLEQIPWSFSIIKLPWMNSIIYTEW